jgi:uncharacterized membrane protein
VPSLHELFAHVCGQARAWAPGGVALPFCTRCTGLYVGGLLAALTCAWLRPAPGPRLLWLHGLLLLQIVPFGYHWLPQGAAASTLTGQLFACGLVYYLALVPLGRLGAWRPRAPVWAYGATLVAGLALVQAAVRWGDARASAALALAGALGLVIYAALVLANLVLLAEAPWRRPAPGSPA